MKIKRMAPLAALVAAMSLAAAHSPAQNIPNPVLPDVADAGVIKYNGKYYIGGVHTNGDFYHSNDLVTWRGPVHVLTMDNLWTKGTGAGDNQIHANDMIYIDGVFHLYWSVNHWGDDRHIVHIAHAESDKILGPYVEPQKDTWMDNRIDPKVFRDDDGKLYMYMVRFTDGNTIWARPMKDARTFEGPVVYQYASLPGTWERMDNRVIEGPWVIKYRDRYYMMFNANHTGTDWGNYQLGVAEADSPTGFDNGSKYPYPLLLSNQTPLEEEYVNVLMFSGTDYDPLFSYVESLPEGDWTRTGYDDGAWRRGRAAFASERVQGSTVRRQGTDWDGERIYLRKTFSPGERPTGNLALRVHHDGPAKVFLNGTPIYESQSADYLTVNLDGNARAALREGENVLAVEGSRGRRGGFVDVALFDMREGRADDVLYSPGQPNILRGPNGFEWWLVYMANKNREPRSQYINRVHFFGQTMYADNVTSTGTPGYFPVPSKPTLGDVFDDERGLSKWNFRQGGWSVKDGELRSPAGERATALVGERLKATSYLFEAAVNSPRDAGVIAWWRDEGNWLEVGLNAASGKWFTRRSVDGDVGEEFFPLTPGFRFGVYHTIAVERDGEKITVRIDDLTRTATPLTIDGMQGGGVPGLFADDGGAAFDGVTYTRGWDEFGDDISGWEDISPAGRDSGEVSAEGLRASSQGSFGALKGDRLADYEYSLQLDCLSRRGTAGVYAAYRDRDNHVAVSIDYASAQLTVKAVRDGRTVTQESLPLRELKTLYADMRYTDSTEKGYTFPTPTWIDGLWLGRTASNNDIHATIPAGSNYDKNVFVDNMFEKMSVEYSSDGKWSPLSGTKMDVAPNPAYTRMTFEPVKADALRFINRDPRDQSAYIYKIRADERLKGSYNIRAVKRDGELIVLVDGRQMFRVDIPWMGPSRVGLLSQGCTPAFDGITRYETVYQ